MIPSTQDTFRVLFKRNKELPYSPFVGEPQSFEVKFRSAGGYTIDLYHLMELSDSMENDLPGVERSGVDLTEETRNTASDLRMGLSTSTSFSSSPDQKFS